MKAALCLALVAIFALTATASPLFEGEDGNMEPQHIIVRRGAKVQQTTPGGYSFKPEVRGGTTESPAQLKKRGCCSCGTHYCCGSMCHG